VTTSGNVWTFFTGAVLIYVAVGAGAVVALRSMRRRWAAQIEPVDVPYGPEPSDEVPARGSAS